jgi:hypothetical protein
VSVCSRFFLAAGELNNFYPCLSVFIRVQNKLLWNNYRVIGFEFYVLAEIFAFGYIFVIYSVELFFATFCSQQNNFIFRGPLGEAAGQGKGLQHRQVLNQGIFAGALDFTQDIKLFAQGLYDIDGHNRVGNIVF